MTTNDPQQPYARRTGKRLGVRFIVYAAIITALYHACSCC